MISPKLSSESMINAGIDSAVVGLVSVSQVLNQMLELTKIPVSEHALLHVNLGHHLPLVRAKCSVDPFFTTKSAVHDRGLAMVDGIVRGLRG